MSPERCIIVALSTFLAARGDRIATDAGLLVVYDDGAGLVAELGGVVYVVSITATRRAGLAGRGVKA